MPEDATLTRLRGAVERGLGRPIGTSRSEAERETRRLEELGVFGVGFHSDERDIEDWVERLYRSQDDFIEESSKEWHQHLLYCANYQHIVFHRGRRMWIKRKTVPWRIRSQYNVVQKAVNIRVSRLTENKPSVSIIAGTTERSDVDKAEYKESLFWHLWQKLTLHLKVVLARRWASKTGMGFLKAGWDPDAGPEIAVTKKRPRYMTKQFPVLDPATGEPVLDPLTGEPKTEPQQVYDGLEEYYVDAKGQDLGPVEEEEEDPENPGSVRRVRREPPPEADYFHEGEVFVEVRAPFNKRWDRYTDDIADSWYVQDASIMPASAILAQFPEAESVLKEAKQATEDDKALAWSGLQPRPFSGPYESPAASSYETGRRPHAPIDKEYRVIETWVFPKNRLVRKLWGRKGALIITVGGKLLRRPVALPEWALHECPFIAFPDIPEEGNHYGKSFLRDLIPIQDDVNRARSHMAEGVMLRERLVLGAPRKHGIRFHVMGGLPGVLVTYRSPAHKPEPINLGTGAQDARGFYESSLDAAGDLGNMNEASTGRLPSAGLAAKAIFALQYADERSITEVSNLQDIALQRLAKALDWITRVEYTERRKIKLVGSDRGYMVEHELDPTDLQIDVDYYFVPGSMLSRQKEAIRNELLTLKEAGLVDDMTLRKFFPVAVPEVYRRSYDLQEAKARRILRRVLNEPEKQFAPEPWDDPVVFIQVFEEFMLTQRWEVLADDEKQAVTQLWQAYKTMLPQAQAPTAEAPPSPNGGGPVEPIPSPEGEFVAPEGAALLAEEAEAAMRGPEPAQVSATGFREPPGLGGELQR